MSHRLLPAAVFVACVLFGFGVGFEAEGQSTDKPDWAPPDWELPWGMAWPSPDTPASPGEGEATQADGASGAESPTDPDDASADATEHGGAAGPEPSAGPGIFPGLVNPMPPAPAGDASLEERGALTGSLSAQLAQLQVLEDQLRTMTEASQAARVAMEAAIAGTPVEPEEPVEPATPAQIEASLELLTDMVKKMKPSKASELLQEWDDKLAIGILRRLGSRRATPILSKMPAAVGGRLTSKIAAGLGALPPVTADGAEASPQGEVQ